jgi:HipA-like protein
VIAGEIARALGLLVPEIVLIDLDPTLGRAEPDPEIQDLIAASAGGNLGMDFLPGALPFNPAVGPPPDPDLAAAVVWLDTLLTNVDRTPRNPNLLHWHGRLWLIDHGAALYLQHGAGDLAAHAHRPFPHVRDHVLLPFAASIAAADERLAPALTAALVEAVVAAVPDDWLVGDGLVVDRRRPYVEYLLRRLDGPRAFAGEAEDARLGR